MPEATATGGQTLNNIGGTPEVWVVGDTWYLVYDIPDSDIQIGWHVDSAEDLFSFYGPGKTPIYNKVLSRAQYNALGVVEFGTTDEIPPGDRDPFSSWVADMELLSKVQPWVLDDDYQSLLAASLVEGRVLNEVEIASTKWFQEHNEAQRNWMLTIHADPETADVMMADARLSVIERLTGSGAGIAPPDEIVDYMTTNWVTGNWSESYLNTQVKAITDPYAGIEVESGLGQLTGDNPVDVTMSAEDTVRDLLHTWLGPAFGTWDDAEISRIAGDIRNDPDAEAAFIESLKDQRMAVLPEFTDRNMSYGAIANTWRQWWIGQWGQAPDEHSDLWMTVLRNNDMTESGKLLRREGYNQGIAKVVDDLSAANVRVGGTERPAVYA